MSDDRPGRERDDSQPLDRPGPMMVMLWAVAAVMLLLVGLWIGG